MSLILAEQKIPALIIAHLIARRSDGDYPTPAANVLDLLAGPVKETTKRTYPSLEVWCPGFTLSTRRDQEQVEIMLDIHASPDTALDTELGWLASIRRAFAGGPTSSNANSSNTSTNPFMAYLAGLSDPARAGWQLDSFEITGGQIHIDDQRRVIYRTTAQALFRSTTFTV